MLRVYTGAHLALQAIPAFPRVTLQLEAQKPQEKLSYLKELSVGPCAPKTHFSL